MILKGSILFKFPLYLVGFQRSWKIKKFCGRLAPERRLGGFINLEYEWKCPKAAA